MVHHLASIMGIQLYNIGGCRPYGPPSCLNYGKSFLIQLRLSNKNPIIFLCVDRFHSSLVREVMLYFTIHDLPIQDFNNTLLTRHFVIWFHILNNKRASHILNSILNYLYTLAYESYFKKRFLIINYPLIWGFFLACDSLNQLRFLIPLIKTIKRHA